MKTVHIHLPWNEKRFPSLFRQTPKELGIWNDYEFHINSDTKSCDYLVIFAGQTSIIKKQVHPKNTLFIAGEPPSIRKYPDAYLAQFEYVISSDGETIHPNKQSFQQGYPWFCGVQFTQDGNRSSVKNYDDFKQDNDIQKTKLMSVVCSDKKEKPGHRKRHEFVMRLKEVFGDDLDVYGRGHNPIIDKSDAIRPYKYHIAIENSSTPDYWTEKLSDCYLEEAFPVYAGCPNLEDYFDKDAFLDINLDAFEESTQRIRNAINNDQHLHSSLAIKEAKRKILDEYNLFNLISNHATKTAVDLEKPLHNFKAYPRRYFSNGLLYKMKLALRELAKEILTHSKR